MPIYDYRCEHCLAEFSRVQSFNDSALTECPTCGKVPRRLIVAPAIVFKGSGWYKNDSRGKDTSESSPKPAGAGTETKADTKTQTKSDAKSDTKTETKTEKAPAAPAKSEKPAESGSSS